MYCNDCARLIQNCICNSKYAQEQKFWTGKYLETTPFIPTKEELTTFEKAYKEGGYIYSDENKNNAFGWFVHGYRAAREKYLPLKFKPTKV